MPMTTPPALDPLEAALTATMLTRRLEAAAAAGQRSILISTAMAKQLADLCRLHGARRPE